MELMWSKDGVDEEFMWSLCGVCGVHVEYMWSIYGVCGVHVEVWGSVKYRFFVMKGECVRISIILILHSFCHRYLATFLICLLFTVI